MAGKEVSQERGIRGEALVAKYLQERGCQLLTVRYTCRYGEIDLIALEGEYLCFVEVKTRSRMEMGLPREAVTLSKQRKLKKAALLYLQSHPQYAEVCCRFDVAEVYLGQPGRIEYLENAFM